MGRQFYLRIYNHQAKLSCGKPASQILLASVVAKAEEKCLGSLISHLQLSFPVDVLPVAFFTEQVYSNVAGIYLVSSFYLVYR
jgi:hypothetical protein